MCRLVTVNLNCDGKGRGTDMQRKINKCAECPRLLLINFSYMCARKLLSELFLGKINYSKFSIA